MLKIKRIFLMLIAILSLVLVTSCDLFAIITGGYTVTYETYGLCEVPSETQITSLPTTLPEPEVAGYEFGGWYYDDAFIVEAYGGDLIIEDTTLYALFKKLAYTITFENTKGQTVQPLKEVTKIPSLPVLETEGYNFGGWYYDSEYKNPVNIGDELLDNITIYAKWSVKKFNITFNNKGHGNDVSGIEEVTTLPDDLPVLKEEGFKFLGWYMDEKFTISAEPGKAITSNVILYAKWQELFNIVYECNGHGTQLDSVYNVSNLPQELPTLTDTGYKFEGWYYDELFTKKASNNDVLTSDVKLYAKWSANEYQVEFDLNGATGSINSINIKYGEELIVPVCSISYTGHKFISWNTKADGSGNTYYELTKIGNLTLEDSITLYAIWEKDTYTVSFNANGGTGIMQDQVFSYGGSFKLSANTFEKTGYTFVGWSTSFNGEKEYDDNDSYTSKAANITLYALWKVNTYTVSFNANGGTGSMENQVITYDKEEKLTKNNYALTGSIFKGWSTSSKGEVVYLDEQKIENVLTSGELKLYAVWEKCKYELTISLNNQTVTYKLNYGDSIASILSLLSTEKEGSTFIGWYTSTKEGQVKIDDTSVTMPDDNLAIFAKYLGEVTITFVKDNETFKIITGFNGNDIEEVISNPVKEGHSFEGWYLDNEFTEEYSSTKFPNEDLVVYAKFTKNSYKVSFVTNIETTLETISLEFGSTINIELIRTGYTLNWYTDSEFINETDFIVPAGDITLYACWTPNEYTIFYDKNNIAASGNIVNKTALYDESFDLALMGFTLTGYKISKWNTKADGTGTNYALGASVKNLAEEGLVTLYAVWEANKYTVSFNANGGTGDMSPQVIVYGSGTSLNINKFTKTGYKFNGWSLKSTGSTVDYIDGYSKDIIFEGSIILYAVWERILYNVTFVTNGHGVQPSQLKEVYKLPSTLPVLVEEGFIFIGWYYNETFTKKANVNDEITNNVTLYAKWEVEDKPSPEPTEKIIDNIIYDDFQIHFLELGNENSGDSTYIKVGDIDILIDAGSRKESAVTLKNYINKYCTDGKLEYVIATHGDQDHIAGFVGNSNNGILYSYQIGTIIDSKSIKTTQIYNSYKTARTYAINKGAKHYTADDCFNNKNGAQDTYELAEGISFTILYNYYYTNSTNDENNNSVCTMFTYNDQHFMFTGDLEKQGEQKLADYYNGSTPERTLPKMELFKGGHHGSNTSTNDFLLKIIQPEIVCVCCCAGGNEYTEYYQNTFPTQGMIDRVAKYTDRLYVTTCYNISKGTFESLNGNIIISSNGKNVGVSATNNTKKLKDSDWFNTTIYADSNGIYYANGKYYTSATSGVTARPQRVWPSN